MSTFLSIIKSILSVAFMLFKYAFYRAISSFFTGLVLLFIAILMFVTFYQAYMPVVSHVKPVYLQFRYVKHKETTYPSHSDIYTLEAVI
jgi:seipin